jgi:phosphate transport system substrate-binding protein
MAVILLLPGVAAAQGGGSLYTVQKDDWLSKIAEKEYGDPLAYTAIVHFNNIKAAEDSSITRIADPNTMEVGWTIYLPSAEEVQGFLASGGTAIAAGVQLPEVNPLEVSGDIISAGSSTVFPLSERMAERFQDEGYAGNITIDSVGSGAGFERFCVAGETDISNASRAIKDEEIAACQAIGRTPIELRVGTDALAIVVNKENTFLTNVTVEQLALIFSTAATNWSDVDPSWPAEPIQRFSPGTDSGTFDYFVEEIFDQDETSLLAAANLQLSEDDNVLVQGVEGSPYAIGYFGYAYYQNNQDRLQALSIDGIAPTAETAESGDYPLARPLFIYSDANIMKSKPQVASFINFYPSFVNDEIVDVGYFPATPSALDAAKQAWLNATK